MIGTMKYMVTSTQLIIIYMLVIGNKWRYITSVFFSLIGMKSIKNGLFNKITHASPKTIHGWTSMKASKLVSMS